MIKRNKFKEKIFPPLALFCTFLGVILLLIFLVNILIDGLSRIDADFITSLPSRKAEKAGILTAWTGSLWIMIMTALISIPIGVCAGVYMEEYSKKSKINTLIEINIANLAGVPSIIYGLLGLEVFGRLLGLGNTILAGSFTLSLLILPIIIVATRESIKAVPKSIKDASYALGATKWETITNHVLPYSVGGILTGVILSISRAIGETAPLIAIGALAYVPFIAQSPFDEFTVLPIQIFNWTTRPQHAFLVNAAAAIIVLLLITFILNGIAVFLRNKWKMNLRY